MAIELTKYMLIRSNFVEFVTLCDILTPSLPRAAIAAQC